jgi:hypothetical protein
VFVIRKKGEFGMMGRRVCPVVTDRRKGARA